MNGMTTKVVKYKGLLFILMMSAIAMAGVVPVDERWTMALHAHKWPVLIRLMNRSVFECQPLGANDPVIFYLLGVGLVYYLGWRVSRLSFIKALRPQCGFVMTSAMISAVFLVHSLKWIVGRARPYEVLQESWAYTDWFSFGPHFVTEGLYAGSFPSGHTAQAFILMTLAYVLAADPLNHRSIRVAGWIWGVLALGLTCAMAAARIMSLNHWISDCLGSIMFGWLLMHLLYFHVLRIPEQRRYTTLHGTLPVLPPVWEIILCAHILMGTVGIMGVLIGTKALIDHRGLWLVLFIPVGAGLIWWARQKAMSLLHSVWQSMEMEIRTP